MLLLLLRIETAIFERFLITPFQKSTSSSFGRSRKLILSFVSQNCYVLVLTNRQTFDLSFIFSVYLLYTLSLAIGFALILIELVFFFFYPFLFLSFLFNSVPALLSFVFFPYLSIPILSIPILSIPILSFLSFSLVY